MKFTNVFFIVEIACIFLYDYFIFLFTKDYTRFIRNVSTNLSKKNILYVKLFQAISLNNNLIDETINAELLKFTDSVPYTNEDVDEKLLKEISQTFSLQKFTSPINSGMISLVYKTKKWDNDIIIKIKRRNIHKKFEDAIEKLLFFIDLIAFFPHLNKFDIPNVVRENIILLREQLDFHKEVENTKEMAKNCVNLKYIRIPHIYENVTRLFPNAIMMDFIKGEHITKLTPDDFDEYAKLVIKYGVVSIVNNSATHGDLHAGNIIFIKNKTNPVYQLGLIDFGIVTRIDKDMTLFFLDILSNLFINSSTILAEKFLNGIICPKNVFEKMDKKILVEEASMIIDEILHGTKNASQVQIYDFIKKFNRYLKTRNLNNLYINQAFVKLQMALAMSQGVGLHLCKNDYMPLANTVFNELFHTDLNISE